LDSNSSEDDELQGQVPIAKRTRRSLVRQETAEQLERDSTLHPNLLNKAQNEWRVECLLEARARRTGMEYHVLWLGFPVREATWEPESNILDKLLIHEFEEARSAAHGGLTWRRPVPRPRANGGEAKESVTGLVATVPFDSTPSCNTDKETQYQRQRHRSACVMAAMWPCGIFVRADELYRAESLSQVYLFVLSLLASLDGHLPNIIGYDDGCHFGRFITNPIRMAFNALTRALGAIRVVIDRFHFRNHTDADCRAHYNPYDRPELKGVNTQICEESFSWLRGYSHIVRHMNKAHFMFFLLSMLDRHNKSLIGRLLLGEK